jgi:hypothetical protein
LEARGTWEHLRDGEQERVGGQGNLGAVAFLPVCWRRQLWREVVPGVCFRGGRSLGRGALGAPQLPATKLSPAWPLGPANPSLIHQPGRVPTRRSLSHCCHFFFTALFPYQHPTHCCGRTGKCGCCPGCRPGCGRQVSCHTIIPAGPIPAVWCAKVVEFLVHSPVFFGVFCS